MVSSLTLPETMQCVFPHNFHTRKLGGITVFFVVGTSKFVSKENLT